MNAPTAAATPRFSKVGLRNTEEFRISVRREAEKLAAFRGLSTDAILNHAPSRGLLEQIVEKEMVGEEDRRRKEAEEEARKLADLQSDLAAKLGLAPKPRELPPNDANVVQLRPATTNPALDELKQKHLGLIPEGLWFATRDEWMALRGCLVGNYNTKRNIAEERGSKNNDGKWNNFLAFAEGELKWRQETLTVVNEVLREVFKVKDFHGPKYHASLATFNKVRPLAQRHLARFMEPLEDAWKKAEEAKLSDEEKQRRHEEQVAAAAERDAARNEFRTKVFGLLKAVGIPEQDVQDMADKTAKKAFSPDGDNNARDALGIMAVNRELHAEGERRSKGEDMATATDSTALIYARAAGMSEDDLKAAVVAKQEEERTAAEDERKRRADPNFGACHKAAPDPKKSGKEDDKKGGGGKKRGKR